jgi:glycosyltransferase involved in cell wall biosynthesis
MNETVSVTIAHSEASVGDGAEGHARDKARWLSRAGASVSRGRIRVLMVLAVPPAMTGSGMVAKHLVKQLTAAGHEVFLSAAGYVRVRGTEVGLPDSHVDTLVFQHPDTDVTGTDVDLRFPIPTFSRGMPFPHIRYTDLSTRELIEFLHVYRARLERLIGKFQPDLIHTHHLFLLNPLVKAIAPWIPVVCQTHGTEQKMLREDASWLPLVAPAARSVEKVLSVSHYVSQEVEEMFGVAPERIVLAGNGVDQSVFRLRTVDKAACCSRLGLGQWRGKVVLYAGKLSDWKGVAHLIRAAKIYSAAAAPVLTLIAGGGRPEHRQQYMHQIHDLGLHGQVVMIDLPGDQQPALSELMSVADAFVLPSVTEPLGMVLLEAMACGCRVVATNRGGPAEIVPQEFVRDGLACLVEPLRLTADGTVDPADVGPFQRRLAEAIGSTLAAEVPFRDRTRISQSVPTWDDVYQVVQQTYWDALRERMVRS